MARNGNTQRQRGYGYEHKKLRKQLEPDVAAGRANCWRCGQRINPGEQWDLGHNADRTGWAGPEHIGCNRATMGRERATLNNAPPVDTSRRW